MLDIFSIQPHEVSRSLRGYTVLFYGEPKSGKTTISTRFPKHLILGFEKGWNAIPGAMALPMNSWGDFLKTLRQLKTPEAKEKFETIIIDTGDIAYDYVEQYICAQNGVDSIGKIPFGGGYGMAMKEFDTKIRSLVQMGYGVVIISHAVDKVFTDENGLEYNQIIPTLPNKARLACSRMCDIIGYSRSVQVDDGSLQTRLFMRGTPRFIAGSRFAYTPDSIEFNYQNLVNAIGDAIDKQVEADGVGHLVKDTVANVHTQGLVELDYDQLMGEFNSLVASLGEDKMNAFGPKISAVIEKHLGRGKKLAEADRHQVELIDIVLTEVKELLA